MAKAAAAAAPMATPLKQRLVAGRVVREHFGDYVGAVAEALLAHGRHTLAELQRGISPERGAGAPDMAPAAVRDALLVLLHHGLAHAREPPARGGCVGTLYAADAGAMLRRLRFPRFAAHVGRELGPEAEECVVQLLLHGRLPAADAVRRAAEALSEDEAPKAAATKAMKAALSKLQAAGYITLVPTSEVGAAAAAGSAAGSAAAGSAGAGAAAAVPGRKRTYSASSAGGTPKAGKKQKRGSAAASASAGDSDELWHVNTVQITEELKRDMCVELIEARLGSTQAQLVKGMFDIAMQAAVGYDANMFARPIAPVELHRTLPSTLGLSAADIKTACDEMCDDNLHVLEYDSGSPTRPWGYRLQVARLCAALKQHCTESVVEERVGPIARRIFRMLMLHKHLEQKQIAELAMVPQKEARKTTYVLYTNKFIGLQEVPRTPDHAPSRTFFLWTVNLKLVLEEITESAFDTMLALRLQLAALNSSSMAAGPQAGSAAPAAAADGGASSGNEDNFDHALRTGSAKDDTTLPLEPAALRRKQRENLDSAIVRLDQTLMVLEA